MSFLPNPIACDVCKTIKTPSNHWYYVEEFCETFQIKPWASEADDPKRTEFVHLCGQVCAVKKLSEWMDSCATPATRDTVS